MKTFNQTASFVEQSCMIVDDEFDPTRKCEWIQMKPRAWHHLDEIFAGNYWFKVLYLVFIFKNVH